MSLECKKCGEKLEQDWDECPVCETPIEKEIKCNNCGEKLKPHWKSCPVCKTEVSLETKCSSCGESLKPNWEVCPECNTPVKYGATDKVIENPKSTTSKKESVFTETAKDLALDMVFVEGGTFTMGATVEQGNDCYEEEEPAHDVSLSDYYIGKYPVTQRQWNKVIGNNPSRFEGKSNPVEDVSWENVQKFITKLNKITTKNYRLPTEAEWEYAARGGLESNGYKYSGSDNLHDVAWFRKNSEDKAYPVGEKNANELGLYEMSGNVYEWCEDYYDEDYYEMSPKRNPQGPSSGSEFVLRGGHWNGKARDCRVTSRSAFEPDDYAGDSIGFRLVLTK